MEKSLLVVQASLQDNAPLTILEAHATGTKVVASLIGGIPELVDAQELDWLFEAGNSRDLAEKLVTAIESSKEKSEVKHAPIESMVNTYLGHYQNLVDA